MPSQTDRVKSIFVEALEHSGAGRRVFLDQACGGDAQLRAEVEAYLSAEGEAGEFLAQPSITLDAPADASSTLLREGPGTIIGNYKLLQVIGEGGFGSVFMAAQEQPVRRRVALKVIKLGMDTKEVVARFEAERQALAMMDHPNIARVLDAGATDSGRPYFVMELVNGIPITAYCDANKLTARQRLELMVPVCRAVQSAHQKGIIHRDLKPSNVMVTLHDGVPVPKVIDFGIAKATGSALTDKTLFTAFHQFIGTPAYMSPEQAEMSGLDIDTRTDVYGLGVLLYELLTGTTPLDSATLKAAAYNEMARLIREFEPSKPSTRLSTLGTLSAVASARGSDGTKLSQTVRGELDWIVMKALEKDRTRRYESASALADDLGRYLEGEAVAAGPISGTYRMRKLARRYKAAIGVATAVAAVLLLGVAGTTIGLVESNHQRTAALISERKATDEAAVALAAKSESDTQRARAEAGEHLAKERLGQVAAERDAKELARKNAEDISEFLGQVFRSPDPARDGSSITVVEMLDRAVKKLETDLSTLPVQRVAFQFELAQTYFALGLTGKAIPLMEKVRDYHLATDGPEDPVTLITTDNLSNFYVHAGRQSEAINMQEQLLPLARKVLGPEGPETLNVMNNLGGYYVIAGRYAAAIKTLEPALVLDKKVLGRENPQTLNAMALLANAYDGAGDSQATLWLNSSRIHFRQLLNNRCNCLVWPIMRSPLGFRTPQASRKEVS